MGVEAHLAAERLRKARDAETAHLEAVLKVNGAKYLRLTHLRDIIVASAQVELRAAPGEEPQLWLDVSHRITMEPDAKTYCLSHVALNRIDTLLQTVSLEEVRDAAENVIAHRVVTAERAGATPVTPHGPGGSLTVFYVWLTGVITGAAALALYLIYMKNISL